MDLFRIGREFGVQQFVSGTIECAGCLLRVFVELANAESGAILLARSYDPPMSASFDAQDSIAAAMRSAVPPIDEAELRRLQTKRPEFIGTIGLES